VAETWIVCVPFARVKDVLIEDVFCFWVTRLLSTYTVTSEAVEPLAVAFSATGDVTVEPFVGDMIATAACAYEHERRAKASLMVFILFAT
jgi:hypothetical protein